MISKLADTIDPVCKSVLRVRLVAAGVLRQHPCEREIPGLARHPE
jgi:hypothetical protein